MLDLLLDPPNHDATEFPILRRYAYTYFDQSWDYTYSDIMEPTDELLRWLDQQQMTSFLHEIERALQENATDEQMIVFWIEKLGAMGWPLRTTHIRLEIERVRNRVRDRLNTMERQSQ